MYGIRHKLTSVNLKRALLVLLGIALLTGAAYAQDTNTTAPTPQANPIVQFTHELVPYDNPIFGWVFSIWDEYVVWGMQDNKEMLGQVQDAYGLQGFPYDVPVLGAVAVGVSLLAQGHLGVIIYLGLNALLFVAIIMFVFNNLNVDDFIHPFVLQQDWIAYGLMSILAALLAIGVSAYLAP